MAVAVVGLAVPAAVGANRYHRGCRLRCHHLPPQFTMNVVFWLIFAAACTSIPLAFDMARLPAGALPLRPPQPACTGRRCSARALPLRRRLLPLLGHLPAVPARARLARRRAHATLATYLWINVVWNYAMCAAVVAGEPDEKKDGGRAAAVGPLLQDGVRAPNLTTTARSPAAVRDNFRFFALFCLWGWRHGGACAMSWTPLRLRAQPGDHLPHRLEGGAAAEREACQALAARSFVFVPALVIFAALTSLFGLNRCSSRTTSR